MRMIHFFTSSLSLSDFHSSSKQKYRYKNALENGIFTLSDLCWLTHELKHFDERHKDDKNARAGHNNIQVKSIVKADIQKVRRALLVAARSNPLEAFALDFAFAFAAGLSALSFT